MSRVSLTIDGKTFRARKGDTVLWAALDNGIYVPNLCSIRGSTEPFAGCRLCFVEVEGRDAPVAACTETVEDGMAVDTQGERARRLARTSLELILASHPVDCARCPANRACGLQQAAAHLSVKLKSKRFRRIERGLSVDSSHPDFTYDPNKCVLCGKCVWTCRERLGVGVFGFAYRGFSRMVTTFDNRPLGESECEGCGDCVAVCPVGSLAFKDDGRAAAARAAKASAVPACD
jgi:formate dehydrogenase major subunit/NADH-quinone oxidoreductase subunit G